MTRELWARPSVKQVSTTIVRRKIALLFEPRDLWIGVYWTREHGRNAIYICLIPMFPLFIGWKS